MARFGVSTSGGKAVSTQHNEPKQLSGCWLIGFFAIFFTVGSLVCVFMAIMPALNTYNARKWKEVPATLEKAWVERHTDTDGDDTYSVEVNFRYTYEGRQYFGDRYSFDFGSSSGSASKNKTVNEIKANKALVCYVDPADPKSAVLNRDLPFIFWIGLFVSIPFTLVGLGGILGTAGFRRYAAKKQAEVGFQSHGGSSTTTSSSSTGTSQAYGSDSWQRETTAFGDVTLKQEQSPLASFIIVTVIALFWNGIVSVFVYAAYEGLTDGKIEGQDIFLGLFLTPFLLVGIGLIVGIFYSFMALFNPRPTLTVNSSEIELGDTIRVKWSFSGNTNSIRELHIFLHGEEKATYRRGTNTHTDEETFAKLTIIKTANFIDIASGEAELTIPPDTMHTFDGGDNEIAWSLDVCGDIAWWPDVNASFPFIVLPFPKK